VALAEMDSATVNTCATTAEGEVWCWFGGSRRVWSKLELPALTEICVSTLNSCGVTEDGYVHCWGPTGTDRVCPP
jgi:hypothetical protein